MRTETLSLQIPNLLSCLNFLWILFVPIKAEQKGSGQHAVISQLLKSYSKQDPPSLERPTEVSIGIYIISFYSMNEVDMEYSLSLYLRQSWEDPRLRFDHIYNKTKRIKMGEYMWNFIWLPDTFFRNEKRARYHYVTVSNRMLRVTATGQLWYVTKIFATLTCPMDLQQYPFDTQICPLMLESFGYTTKTLYFTWLPAPVDVSKEIQMPQFKYLRYNLSDCSTNYTGGSFPCLQIMFWLRREVGYFLIQLYIPSILIVILSWLSFWINVESSPARVNIGLLTVLSISTMTSGISYSLPKVSYIKAIDVWMIVCLVYVFSSLIEYAVVNSLARRQRVVSQMQIDGGIKPEPPRYLQGSVKKIQRLLTLRWSSNKQSLPRSSGLQRARQIDQISRRVFPITFLLFQIIYWSIYGLPYIVSVSNDWTDEG